MGGITWFKPWGPTMANRTKLREPPDVVEVDSGVGPSLSPSACISEPFYPNLRASIKFFDKVEKDCKSGENFNWDGHDLQLNIPNGALPRETAVTISFGASISGNFRLPASMKLVSAVFLVEVTPSSCFKEDVELKIPHCLDLSAKMCDNVFVIHAPFDKAAEAFNFKKLCGGIFKPDLEYGSIWTKDFCLMAVAAAVTPLCALAASDLPKASVQLLPQQPVNPCYKTIAYFCIPADQTELAWDVYVMISLKVPSMAVSIMRQLQEYHKLPEPIKIDSQTIKFNSSIYLDIADISDSGWTVRTRTFNQVAMEDVNDFEYSPEYPPHIILEVKSLETEVTSRFPGCELTIRDAMNKSQIGYYRLPSSSGSRSNYKGKKMLTMADVQQQKVVQMVASKWESVGYALGLDDELIDIIKCDHREVEKRCEELFHRWLRGDKGKYPKTWSVLFKALSEISELTAVREKLEQKLNIST